MRLKLGNALAAQNKLDEAVRVYREAIWSKLDFATAYLNLGIVLARQGRVDESAEAFREAQLMDFALIRELAIEGGDAVVAVKELNPLETALAEFRAARGLEPGSAERMMNLGIAYLNLSQLDDAVAALAKRSGLGPVSRRRTGTWDVRLISSAVLMKPLLSSAQPHESARATPQRRRTLETPWRGNLNSSGRLPSKRAC